MWSMRLGSFSIFEISVLKDSSCSYSLYSSATNAFNKNALFFFFDCLGHFYKEKVWINEESL